MPGYVSPPDVQAPVASVVASPVAGVAMNPAAPVPPFDSSQVGSTPFAVPPPPSATLPPVAGNLATFPRAPFLDRLGAFALDFFLVVIVTSWFTGLLDFDGPFSPRLWLVLVAYHVGFWVWRSTTVGGIICNLRVIRTDGAPLQLPEALVRGFSAILSLAALGLGAFWILIDPERQAWHDRIAGTYVIKVPRNYQG
jgi:uncharacterized RDD family membrane protein YckC